MQQTTKKIYIIGAGISGLIAAKTLESKGYIPTIIEASDRVGGRLRSERVNGYVLDKGFQVILSAYPAVKKWVNWDAIPHQKLLPGATLYNGRRKDTIGDPLRDVSFLFSTLFSKIGNIGDKRKVLGLKKKVLAMPTELIFTIEEISSRDYLLNEGFSEEIISGFFKPFFTGIFLEANLETSAKMFLFVYKMFSEGSAIIPNHGIAAIPEFLRSSLQNTTIQLHTKVTKIEDGSKILLENGAVIQADKIIIATNPAPLLENMRKQDISWKSCENVYFTMANANTKPILHLLADDAALVNSFYIDTNQIIDGKALVSITIVKEHTLDNTALINQCREELKTYCNLELLDFIQYYKIKKALPDCFSVIDTIAPSECQLSANVFLAGDHLLNPSLQAAMVSGEAAANGLIETMDGVVKF